MSTETQQATQIAGIPTSIPQQNLEEKVCRIFKAINVSVDKSDIDDCHRLRDKERTIVKFLRCKDCKQVLRCKKDLRSINMSNLDLPEGTKLFINESLCPYYKGSLGHLQKNVEQEANTFLFYY